MSHFFGFTNDALNGPFSLKAFAASYFTCHFLDFASSLVEFIFQHLSPLLSTMMTLVYHVKVPSTNYLPSHSK